MVNDFEYCTNGMPKLMLRLEGLSITVDCIFVYIMSSELTNGNTLTFCDYL